MCQNRNHKNIHNQVHVVENYCYRNDDNNYEDNSSQDACVNQYVLDVIEKRMNIDQ